MVVKTKQKKKLAKKVRRLIKRLGDNIEDLAGNNVEVSLEIAHENGGEIVRLHNLNGEFYMNIHEVKEL